MWLNKQTLLRVSDLLVAFCNCVYRTRQFFFRAKLPFLSVRDEVCENHSALAKIIFCLDKWQLSIFLFADYAFDFFNVLWVALLDREGLAEDFIALKRPLANLNSICSLNRSHGCLLPSASDFLLLLSAIGKNHA